MIWKLYILSLSSLYIVTIFSRIYFKKKIGSVLLILTLVISFVKQKF